MLADAHQERSHSEHFAFLLCYWLHAIQDLTMNKLLPAIVSVAALLGLGTVAVTTANATPDITGIRVAQRPNCKNPQTQGEMNACAGIEYQNADKKLNQVYKQLLPRLQSSRRQKLISAQQAWIKFRDASCTYERTEFAGGTMEPMVYSNCLAAVTQQRTAQLEQYLSNADR